MSLVKEGSLTQELVRLVCRKDIEESDLHWTALFTLDAISSIVGGSTDPSARPLLTWAGSEPVNTGRLAFLYGGLATVLELDAMHRGSSVHAGTIVVPAVMAMARERQFSGRRLLAAILRGSEAAFRVGRAAGPSHYKIYQNTATCGPYGSALAAGLLLDLSQEQLVHALGNAGTQASGLWEYRETGALTKQLHAGRAAEAGIISSQLAAQGFTGPLKILEGARGFFKAACPDAAPTAVLSTPDQAWELRGMSIKPWPSSRHTHPAIDAALKVRSQLSRRNISSVEVQTYQAAVDLCAKRKPSDAHHGKSSIEYCVAAALIDGEVSGASYTHEAFDRYQSLIHSITVSAAEPYMSSYPTAWGARVEVCLVDGGRASFCCEHVKGDPEASLTESEMREKAAASLELGGVRDTKNFIESVMAMLDDAPMPTIPVSVN